MEIVSASAGESVATGVSGAAASSLTAASSAGRIEAEDQHLRAEEQHAAVVERHRPVDAASVDERAVGAAEIVNHEQLRPLPRALNARVQSGDGASGEGQRRRTRRRRGAPPDVERQLGHRHEARRARSCPSEAPSPITISAPCRAPSRLGPPRVGMVWRDLVLIVDMGLTGQSAGSLGKRHHIQRLSRRMGHGVPTGHRAGPLCDAPSGRAQPGPVTSATQRGGCVLPRGTGWPLPGRPTIRRPRTPPRRGGWSCSARP